MRLTRRLLLLVPLVAAAPVAAQLPRAAPEAAGLSSARLRRIRPMLDSAVAGGEVTGVLTLLARNGMLVELDSAGYADREAGTPMRSNTLFRLASMTKAVTSVAAMMLVEDGRLLLADPVARYLPAFREMRVVMAGADSGKPMAYERARRRITIRDLLTHRSGLAYGFIDDGPVGDGYRAAGITDGIAGEVTTVAENVDRLAKQPLAFQPGTRWSYALNTDVLGRVVEIVSGKSLAEFMQERIFAPLGMRETSFRVPDAQASRLVVPYMPDSTGKLVPMRGETQSFSDGRLVLAGAASLGSATYFSGGAGLVGTGGDYLRFLQMLANGGELDGVRVLSRKTVELMTASHTGDLAGNPLGAGNGFGLGFLVLLDPGAAGEYGSPGTYSWGGIYGTEYWVDPKEHLVGVMMIQRYPTAGIRLQRLFRMLAYTALVK